MIHAVLVGVGHMIRRNLLGGGIQHIMERRNGLPSIGEHGAVMHDGSICRQLIPHLNDGDVLTLLGQEHTGLHADLTAADHHYILADLFGMPRKTRALLQGRHR